VNFWILLKYFQKQSSVSIVLWYGILITCHFVVRVQESVGRTCLCVCDVTVTCELMTLGVDVAWWFALKLFTSGVKESSGITGVLCARGRTVKCAPILEGARGARK